MWLGEHLTISLLARWNRFVRDGGNADSVPDQSKQKGLHTAAFCLTSSIHNSERAFFPAGEVPRHNFQVRSILLTYAFS